jgi:hypothetical protein
MSLFSLPLDVTPTPIMAQYNASYSWVTIVIYALFVIALWRMFTKAGRPGWAAGPGVVRPLQRLARRRASVAQSAG